ncbi:MAG: chromosome partitioning protein ParB, partial [Muribaculaceae bacterium]|nr:chromosome partitioning protein ParB [Muribaculaceae bacterium]
RDKAVDMGHARALLSVEKPTMQLKLYNEILKKGLSVRQVEQRAKEMNAESGDAPAKPKAAKVNNADYDVLKKHLSKSFGVAVSFACNQDGKGKITFPFKNEEELERIIRIFDKLKN